MLSRSSALFSRILPLVFVLAAALLAARCDALVEPVAITPDALRPAIVTALSVSATEDGSIMLDVEADDPSGETMTLTLTTPPMHGTAVLEAVAGQAPAAARTGQPGQDPGGMVPNALPETTPTRQRLLAQKSDETARKATPRRATPTLSLAQKNAQTGGAAGLSASVRVIRGAAQATASAGAVVVGRIRYTPEADFNGVDRFGFAVRNTSGYTSEAEVTVRIGAEPDAPFVAQPLSDLNLAPGQRITINLRTENVFADIDGDALTYSAQSRDPAIATAEVINDEVLTVQALNAPNQAARIDVTATDPGGLSATTPFTVTVEASDNHPPQVENRIPDRAIVVGEAFAVALHTVFTDDDGDALAFTAASGNPAVARAEIVPPDTLRVTMLTTGLATITVTASDGIATTQTTFLVFLNPGVNAADDNADTDADVPVVIDVLENDRDSNNGPLTVAGFLQFPAHGSVEVIDAGQRVRYTPNPVFFGEDGFVYVASNEQGDLDQATVTVTVREVNRPPEITDLQGTANGLVGETFTFAATAIDPNDGDVLTYSWDFGDGSDPVAGVDLTTVSHVYTVDDTLLVTLTVTDQDDAVDTATLSVLVARPPEPEPKPVAIGDLYRLSEGDTLVVEAAQGVLANDRDPRGDGLTATLTRTVARGALTFEADGSFTYTHDGSETTTDAFRYRASDGVNETNEASVTFAITPVNDLPLAVDDSYTLDQGGMLSVAPEEGVLSNDTDTDDDDLAAVLVTSVANGTLTLFSTGSFNYTPDPSFFGSDGFTYRANDGTDDSNVATVSLRVNQVGNTPPEVTNPGPQNSVEAQPITPLQIEASDPDPPLRYTSASLPPGLGLDLNSGLVTGSLPSDAAGPTGTMTYPVTVFVTDRRGGLTSVTFDWTVTNPAPTVLPVSNQNHDEGETIAALLIQATDDDTSLSYDDAGTLPPGLFIDADTGVINGVPTSDAAGPTGTMTYPVTITVSDSQGGSNTTAFDWTITNPDPAVNNPGDQNNTEGDVPTLQIQAADDDPVTYAASNLPVGLLIDPNTGMMTGAIANDAAGPTGMMTYPVTIIVSDSQGGSNTTAFDWTVTNPAPVVNNPGDQADSEGQSVSLQIQATDDDTITYDATALPPGLAIDAASGLISGVVAMGASAASPYMVEVTVTDGQAGAGAVLFAWTVTNPPPVVTNPGDQNHLEGEAPTLQIMATDPDVPLTYTATGLPTGLTIDAATGLIDGVIADDAAGATGTATFMVDVTVTDSQGAAATVSFDWTITNPAPVVTDPGDQSTTGGETVSLPIQAADDDSVTYDAVGLPPGLGIDAGTGVISGTIALDAGSNTPYPVAITVTDDQTGSTVVQFDWSVDVPLPTLGSLSPSSATQGATLDVTLTGTNFIDGVSTVAFSGVGIILNTTTVNSDTEIVVTITLDVAAPPGDRDVTVTNTGPGGGVSAAQPFTVTM